MSLKPIFKKATVFIILSCFFLSIFSSLAIAQNSEPIKIFVIHSSTSTKMTNDAAHNIMNLINEPQLKHVSFNIRSTAQIGQMSRDELKSLIENAGIIIVEWMFEPGLSNFRNVVNANPDIVKNRQAHHGQPLKCIFSLIYSYLKASMGSR